MISSGPLDRRIAILRRAPVDDGVATTDGPPVEIGRRWASKTDATDMEQVRAAENGQELTSWFVVRSDSLTRTITGKDVIVTLKDGRPFEVTGTKEQGRNDGIEITAVARPDMAVAP